MHLIPPSPELGVQTNAFSVPQYITWVNNNKSSWTMNAGGTAADSRVNIGPRPVPQEPMVRVPAFAHLYSEPTP